MYSIIHAQGTILGNKQNTLAWTLRISLLIEEQKMWQILLLNIIKCSYEVYTYMEGFIAI